MLYSVIAAKDGDVYRDEVEAVDQEEAERRAREQLAAAWYMTDTLQNYRDEGDEAGFDAELDGFAVDPTSTGPFCEISQTEAEAIAWAVQWAGHFATIVGDCKPSGPALSYIAAATRAIERSGLPILHSAATRQLIEATHG